MPDLIDARLDAAFALYDELAASLDGDRLRQKLPVPSNTIGLQLWCVVGARAMASGTWGPFACSLNNVDDPAMVADALAASAAAFREASAAAPDDDTRTDLKLGLLEHEAQHMGQLLRYLLGLGIEVPPGWRQRFAL